MRPFPPYALRAFAASIVLLALSPIPSKAVVITSGCANVNASCTLTELILGGTIQTNSLVFSSFAPIRVLGFGGARFPNINNVVVTGLDDGGLDPGPGLLFDLQGQWNVFGPGLIDFETSFTVTSLANPIKDSSIDLGPGTFASGSNSASGVEDFLFELEGGPPIFRLVADMRPSDDFYVPSIQTQFAPRPSVFGLLTFRSWAGGTPGGAANLDQFTLRFSQLDAPDAIPEPTTWTMLLAGLFLLGRVRRTKG